MFPEIPERWKEIHRRSLAGGIEKAEEDPFPRADGRLDWVRWEIHPWYETNGEIGGVILFSEVITERKRAEEEVRRRAEELAALNALGNRLSQSLSLEETCEAAIKGMLDAAHPDAAYLFLREGGRLLLKGIGPEAAAKRLGAIPEHRVGECICGLAALEGRALYSRDIFTDMRCTWEECKKAGFRSFAALPLRSGADIIGVLGLAADTERDFETQAGFLETLAGQVSIAIENARLFENTRRRLNELEALHLASLSLSQTRDMSDLGGQILSSNSSNG